MTSRGRYYRVSRHVMRQTRYIGLCFNSHVVAPAGLLRRLPLVQISFTYDEQASRLDGVSIIVGVGWSLRSARNSRRDSENFGTVYTGASSDHILGGEMKTMDFCARHGKHTSSWLSRSRSLTVAAPVRWLGNTFRPTLLLRRR